MYGIEDVLLTTPFEKVDDKTGVTTFEIRKLSCSHWPGDVGPVVFVEPGSIFTRTTTLLFLNVGVVKDRKKSVAKAVVSCVVDVDNGLLGFEFLRKRMI